MGLLPFVEAINAHRKNKSKHPLKIIPLLVGKSLSDSQIETILTYISQHPNTFLLANTDLRHEKYVPLEKVASRHAFDKATIQNIAQAIKKGTPLESVRDNEPTMCAPFAVEAFTKIAHRLGFQPKDIQTSDSFASLLEKDKDKGYYVGYPSMTLWSQWALKKKYDSELKALPAKVLQENKKSLGKRYSSDAQGEVKKIHQMALKYNQANDQAIEGLFVTIYKDSDLRGCIGSFKANDGHSIHYWIARQTLESALQDSRFEKPLTADEIDGNLSFEINVLDRRFTIYSQSSNTIPFNAFWEHYQHNHGIQITFEAKKTFGRDKRATYLPSVLHKKKGTIENIFNEVVTELRKKAGASPSAKIKKIELYVSETIE